MRTLFSTVARAFVRVFAAAFVVYVGGILAAPNFIAARSLALAGLLAAIAAGLRALTVFVPRISVAHYVGDPWGTAIDSFIQAALASLLVSIPALLSTPDYSTWRQLALAAVLGAATAGVRAVQGLFTIGEKPAPALGLAEPPPSPSIAPVAAPPPPPAAA